MGRAFFSDAKEALIFAFNHEDTSITSPVMNREMAESKVEEVKGAPQPEVKVRPTMIPKHVPLGGLNDRTIMAAWILSKLAALETLHQHLLSALLTRSKVPCECGAKCCQGWSYSKPWGASIQFLVSHLKHEAAMTKKPGARGYSTDPRLRIFLVEDFTREEKHRKTLARLSHDSGMSSATVAAHRNLIYGYLEAEATEAWMLVAEIFDRTGITGEIET